MFRLVALIATYFKILTQDQGEQQDLYRVLAVLSVGVAIGLTIYDVTVLHREWHVQDFGIGIGSLLAGVGVAIGLRRDGASQTPTSTDGDPRAQ